MAKSSILTNRDALRTLPALSSQSPARLRALHTHLASLPDPRMWRAALHPLGSILFIALCAVLCGADSFTEMEVFARQREAWLRAHIPLGARLPSHDTFNRVLSAVFWHDLESALRRWTLDMLPPTATLRSGSPPGAPVHYALDGKVMRGSRRYDPESGAARHTAAVNLWAAESGLVLTQRRIPEQGSEITSLQQLLGDIRLKGALLSMDALHAQQETLSIIIRSGGEYLVSLKSNQPRAHREITALLDAQAAAGAPAWQSVEKGHGRLEQRRLWVSTEVTRLETRGCFSGLSCIMLLERESENQRTGEKTTGRRYYLSSLPGDAAVLAAAARRHWEVETKVHWLLDTVFGEDRHRARSGYAASNLSALRKTALNLLRRARPAGDSTSFKSMRLMAALNESFLADIIAPILAPEAHPNIP